MRALSRIGIDASKIETVVISHLHYDHASTLDRFPAAHFHVQEAEVAYAIGPCMCEDALRRAYSAEHVCNFVRKIYSGRVEFCDSDAEVAPGITVHRAGGHTKGLQCMRVATETGHVVLASDAAHLYENFERRKPFSITVDVAESLRSCTKLERLATSRAHIIPGHDPLVFEPYPAWKPQTQGFVHRLDVARLK